MSVESLAYEDRRALSAKEREAACLLYEDGWSVGVLAMVFEASEGTIRRSLRFEGVVLE